MKILTTETAALFEAAVAEAARRLKAGEAVAVPTETVYGLAANALDAAAVGRIFAAKGRPSHNPLIVHVNGLEMARKCAAAWPERAGELAARHWPGPLTLVLPKADAIPDAVTAGGGTVAIRWPSHPFMQAVILRCGFPLAAPSANPSNQVSPTNAGHVAAALRGRIGLVVDGGQCQVGIESTVFDVMANRVLRPGMISAAELEVGGKSGATEGTALRSPGLLAKHYSPRARLVLRRWKDATEALEMARAEGASPARTRVIAYERIPAEGEFQSVAVIPEDAEAYARALYAELHRCDESGAELILVERPPDGPKWEAIQDRLKRAASR